MIDIKRIYKESDATLGIMLIDKVPFFWTLEEPWRNNTPEVSCIPSGHYRAHAHDSKKFGQCFIITDLQNRNPSNRNGILIHAGNTISDTSGCILVGLEVGQLNEKKAVLKSKEAFARFMQRMTGIVSCDLVIS